MERQSCYEIGIVERGDLVLARDLMIERNGKRYVVSVGTPQYKSDLESHRAQEMFEHPAENEVLIMDNIPSVEEVCEALSSMPFEDLQPYITEQELLEDNAEQ